MRKGGKHGRENEGAGGKWENVEEDIGGCVVFKNSYVTSLLTTKVALWLKLISWG